MPKHEIYIDPLNGNDDNHGRTPITAKKTLPSAENIGNRRVVVLSAEESARIRAKLAATPVAEEG